MRTTAVNRPCACRLYDLDVGRERARRGRVAPVVCGQPFTCTYPQESGRRENQRILTDCA